MYLYYYMFYILQKLTRFGRLGFCFNSWDLLEFLEVQTDCITL